MKENIYVSKIRTGQEWHVFVCTARAALNASSPSSSPSICFFSLRSVALFVLLPFFFFYCFSYSYSSFLYPSYLSFLLLFLSPTLFISYFISRPLSSLPSLSVSFLILASNEFHFGRLVVNSQLSCDTGKLFFSLLLSPFSLFLTDLIAFPALPFLPLSFCILLTFCFFLLFLSLTLCVSLSPTLSLPDFPSLFHSLSLLSSWLSGNFTLTN